MTERRRTLNAKAAKTAKKNMLCALSGFWVLSGCRGVRGFRQYEYEEDLYLSLDGSATLYVNGSLAALNALRGTSFDLSPTARFDRDTVRDYYTSPDTHVVWVRN